VSVCKGIRVCWGLGLCRKREGREGGREGGGGGGREGEREKEGGREGGITSNPAPNTILSCP
jgi:hypothetical protein